MTMFTQWKSIAYVADIFATGSITGASIALSVVHHESATPVRARDMAQRLRHRLESRLKLTPAQVQKIGPIIDKLGEDMKSVQVETIQRLGKLLDTANAQIATELTPEQKCRFEAMQKKRRELSRDSKPFPRRNRRGSQPGEPGSSHE